MGSHPTVLPDRSITLGRVVAILAAVFGASILCGCSGAPSAANTLLRKQVADLTDQNNHLNAQHAADQASIAAATGGGADSLSPGRLDTLFTAAQLKVADRTGGDRSITGLAYDDRLKIYVAPIDAYGDVIKAAGSFRVQAFDLAATGEQAIGDWKFPLADAEKNWYGKFLLYNYVLECPWQKPPRHSELTIKVTFIDALTRRQLEAQIVVHVTLPPPGDAPAAMSSKAP
jgi:hypothetical protein